MSTKCPVCNEQTLEYSYVFEEFDDMWLPGHPIEVHDCVNCGSQVQIDEYGVIFIAREGPADKTQSEIAWATEWQDTLPSDKKKCNACNAKSTRERYGNIGGIAVTQWVCSNDHFWQRYSLSDIGG